MAFLSLYSFSVSKSPSSRIAIYGWIEFQPKLLFLHGKPLGGRFSLLIGFREEGGSSLTAVFCVVVKRKR